MRFNLHSDLNATSGIVVGAGVKRVAIVVVGHVIAVQTPFFVGNCRGCAAFDATVIVVAAAVVIVVIVT